MRLEEIEQLLAVAFVEADEALHEVAEQQGVLAGLRVDLHHGMLGLVDGSGEDFVEMLAVGVGGARLHGIIVGVAVHRPQAAGELAQRRRQILVGRDRVGEHRVATELGNHHPAQDREFGMGVDERDVGVPLIGPPAAAAGVELEDRRRALQGADRGMRHEIAQASGETLLLGIVEMMLSTEEDHLVAQQQAMDGLDSGIGQIAGQGNVADLGAQTAGPPHHIGFGNEEIGRGGGRDRSMGRGRGRGRGGG